MKSVQTSQQRHYNDVNDIVVVSLLITNFSVFIVDFELVSVSLGGLLNPRQRLSI